MADHGIAHRQSTFSQALNAAARLPGVRIDRAAYLRGALRRHCTQEQIDRAIAESPAAAGIPMDVITAAANVSIAFESSKVTGLSAVAGIPGGVAMVGTVPADMAQYVGHMLRVAQKLAYIHGWPDLVDGGEIDEATEAILTLFLGVMLGVQAAQVGCPRSPLWSPLRWSKSSRSRRSRRARSIPWSRRSPDTSA